MKTPSPSLRRRARHLAAALLLSSASFVAAAAPPAAPAAGWWRDATFYEIFVRSFADASHGPLAGDGIGDLQGLIEHLDYLNDGRGAAGRSLGIDAVWLMPIQPSPSYHGYDVTDYFAVNPQFGDLPLMRRFVSEAHRRGIRVIVDLVLNHTSSRHPLFQQALRETAGGSARRMFRFAPLPEQLWGNWGERLWHPAGDAFYYGAFGDQMPDWNFREPAVTAHHRRAAEFWLRAVGVDGFRLDAVRYFYENGDELLDTAETRQWLKEFTDYCHAVKPDSFVIGEDTARVPEVARCLRGGAMDSAFEFDLAHAIVESIRLQTGGILTQTLQQLDTLYGRDPRWATFLSNHDQDRIRTQLGDREDRTRLAAKLLFTLPGVTFIYYGEELGVRGAKPDPELRTPMPWSADWPNAGFTAPTAHPWHPLNADFKTVNVAAESGPDSMLSLYRRLIALRASSPALRHGAPVAITVDDPRLFVMLRTTADEAVIVLANPTDAPRPGPILTLHAGTIPAGWIAREEIDRVPLAPPWISPDGGIANWSPVKTLPPNTVYAIRFAAPPGR